MTVTISRKKCGIPDKSGRFSSMYVIKLKNIYSLLVIHKRFQPLPLPPPLPSQPGRKEGNVLFNDALNTFYLWLYSVRLMVEDHKESKRGNPQPPHGLLFPINSKGPFICTIPQTGLHIPRPLLRQLWITGWNEN